MKRKACDVAETLARWREYNAQVEPEAIKAPAKGSKKGCMKGKGGPDNSGCNFRGVRQRVSGNWVGEIRVPNKGGPSGCASSGQKLWLGTFQTAIDAAVAYDEAARSIYSFKACLNFPCGNPTSAAVACPGEAKSDDRRTDIDNNNSMMTSLELRKANDGYAPAHQPQGAPAPAPAPEVVVIDDDDDDDDDGEEAFSEFKHQPERESETDNQHEDEYEAGIIDIDDDQTFSDYLELQLILSNSSDIEEDYQAGDATHPHQPDEPDNDNDGDTDAQQAFAHHLEHLLLSNSTDSMEDDQPDIDNDDTDDQAFADHLEQILSSSTDSMEDDDQAIEGNNLELMNLVSTSQTSLRTRCFIQRSC